MNRIARLAGWLTGPTLTALLVTPTAASATGPAPDGPSRPQVVVEQVPVPVKVPVDDRTAEAVQMGTAAALGAAIATIAGSGRLDRPAGAASWVAAMHCRFPVEYLHNGGPPWASGWHRSATLLSYRSIRSTSTAVWA